jgi:hypothetical protein
MNNTGFYHSRSLRRRELHARRLSWCAMAPLQAAGERAMTVDGIRPGRCWQTLGASVLKQIVRIRQALVVKKKRSRRHADRALGVGAHGEILIGE